MRAPPPKGSDKLWDMVGGLSTALRFHPGAGRSPARGSDAGGAGKLARLICLGSIPDLGFVGTPLSLAFPVAVNAAQPGSRFADRWSSSKAGTPCASSLHPTAA